MMIFTRVSLILISILATLYTTEAKIYQKCELVNELRRLKVHEEEIPTWICIVEHESNYDSEAMNPGSGDHGLFQISQLYWCLAPPLNEGYGCNSPCTKFRDDDISDDVQCIRRIFNEHKRISGNGFTAWVAYLQYCQDDNSRFIEDCKEEEQSQNTTESNEVSNNENGDEYEFPDLPQREAKELMAKDDVTTQKLPFSKISINYAVPVVKVPFSKVSIHYSIPVPVEEITTTQQPFADLLPAPQTRQDTITQQPDRVMKQVTFAPNSFFSWLFNSQTLPPIVPPIRPSRPPGSARPPAGRPQISQNVESSLTTRRPFRPHTPRRPGITRPRNGRETELKGNFILQRTKFGAPVMVSFPHLLHTDLRYGQSVTGLQPNETIHEMFVNLEPITGTPLKLAKRVQFNLFLRPVNNITVLQNAPEALVPLFWIEETVTLPLKYQDFLERELHRSLLIVNAIRYSIIGVALAIICCCIFIFLWL